MKFSLLKFLFDLPLSQRKGIYLLSVIILCLIIAPVVYKNFFYKPKIYDFEPYRKEIESLIIQNKTTNKNQKSSIENLDLDNVDFSIAKSNIKPFNFNPNNLPAEEWLRMGFSKHQVRSIKNYESKGGRFFSKQDVKKMFVISDEEYKIIEPYILLPDSNISSPKTPNNQTVKKIEIVELNSADTTLIQTLPGIGAFWARRIVWHRDKLGGFINKSQLFEIKDFDSTKFSQIEKYIDINPYLVKKININTCNLEQLRRHPYVSNNVAISIINIRNQHGKFASVEAIMKSELIDEQLLKKLYPYLTTE